MAGTTPYAILVGPARVYAADVGTAFPTVATATPPGPWVDLGRSDGATRVQFTQTIVPITVDQETGALKAVRTAETLKVGFNLVEATLENFKRVLNNLTVTTNAGVDKVMGFYQDVQVNQFALLVRFDSAYTANRGQVEVPKCYQSAEPEISFTRENKSIITAEFSALIDDSQPVAERFGRIRMSII